MLFRSLFERMWKTRTSILAAQRTDAVAGSADPSFYDRGFGPELQTEIESLRSEAEKMLRPLAQLRASAG